MKKWVVFLIFCLSLVGCRTLPRVGFTWPESEKDLQIQELQTNLNQVNKELQGALEEKTAEIVAEETDRISLGSAQVYAAYGTLDVHPDPDKYVKAASGALSVAKEALPNPKVEDLIAAIEVQKKLLSEQAAEIQEGKKLLALKSNEIIQSKQKVDELELEKDKIRKEKEETKSKFTEELTQLAKERDQEKLALLQERDKLAQKWQKENSFWNRINPFRGLMKTFSSLFFWIIAFVVFGGILKLASILFPGINIIQTLIGGIGRIFGSIFGMLFRWIPDALRGMHAVDYKEYAKERQIANNLVGGIQEVKYDNPEEYKTFIKPKLLDWNKDNPELEKIIDKKLKELNLV